MYTSHIIAKLKAKLQRIDRRFYFQHHKTIFFVCYDRKDGKMAMCISENMFTNTTTANILCSSVLRGMSEQMKYGPTSSEPLPLWARQYVK